jgi:uncharacterized protein (DUF433 family)
MSNLETSSSFGQIANAPAARAAPNTLLIVDGGNAQMDFQGFYENGLSISMLENDLSHSALTKNERLAHTSARLPDSLSELPSEVRQPLVDGALERLNMISVGHWADVAKRHDRVLVDVWINHGRPTVRGTRVAVFNVLGLICFHGVEAAMSDYSLSDEDVQAVANYAVEVLGG